MIATVGSPVPDFELPAHGNRVVRLSALRGYIVVLYFYPKDDTPGCTIEAQEFRDHLAELRAERCTVIGVSRDSLSSHERFVEKFAINFPLISDPDGELCQMFDVIKTKMMYGRETRGIERSSFLIDRDGVLRQEWRKVKAEGHAEQVLFAVQSLNKHPAAPATPQAPAADIPS